MPQLDSTVDALRGSDNVNVQARRAAPIKVPPKPEPQVATLPPEPRPRERFEPLSGQSQGKMLRHSIPLAMSKGVG
jgi:hypothetical protein